MYVVCVNANQNPGQIGNSRLLLKKSTDGIVVIVKKKSCDFFFQSSKDTAFIHVLEKKNRSKIFLSGDYADYDEKDIAAHDDTM